jgi:hypothetical protein
MLFKWSWSFRFFFVKISGNVDELKAYPLVPLTPPSPLPFYSTLSRHVGAAEKDLSERKIGDRDTGNW